ncbi:VOC family protein [Arthrobacter sp. CAN_C5]|uniref:VOC family protein n=1 Tax=Arthrobacter sp. CAN_C5 TaxID=2760706 RepID=UPI001AE1B77B|nr:VOC family protein [Arthrobacter sp. CAN_C5]MBP2215258.1 catechol 2,3-dioxygenase-like lactoylglutathione lyase family enzyme [Arthrobacter sp. CAN_C5]
MRYTLEVVPVPVSDVERAKAFYADQVGFILDFDIDGSVVQLTPPGSGCSIQIGRGLTRMAPGSLEGLQLVVTDLDAAHQELTGRGVELSEIEVYARDGLRPRLPKDDLNNVGFCTFADPDGNRWTIQQISEREL